eukprot:7378362-Prymnesium_polylepis.1
MRAAWPPPLTHLREQGHRPCRGKGVPDAGSLTDSEAGHMVKHTHIHTACKALTTLSMHHRCAALH